MTPPGLVLLARACFCAAFAAVVATVSLAKGELVRRRFDPEDLQLEKPGDVHADLQFGIVRGPTAGRFQVPDFGVDIGVTREVELGVDGAISLEGTPGRAFARDHVVADNVWLSSKIGLLTFPGGGAHTSWSVGVQLGPKLPAAPDAHGAGFQTIALLGRAVPGFQLTFNAGAFVDPGDEVARGRPAAIEGGVDFDLDLTPDNEFSLLGDVSVVAFLSSDPHQLQTTFGPEWNLHDVLAISAQALFGLLPQNDRVGLFLVISPRVGVFR